MYLVPAYFSIEISVSEKTQSTILHIFSRLIFGTLDLITYLSHRVCYQVVKLSFFIIVIVIVIIVIIIRVIAKSWHNTAARRDAACDVRRTACGGLGVKQRMTKGLRKIFKCRRVRCNSSLALVRIRKLCQRAAYVYAIFFPTAQMKSAS